MNYTKYLKTALFASAMALLCGGLSSCEDNIDLGRADSGKLEPVNGVYVALNNITTPRAFQNLDIYTDKEVSTPVNILLTRAANEIIDCKLAFDAALVAEYNAKNGTDFEAYPAELVKFENDGFVSVAPGDTESFTVNMTVEPIPSSQIAGLEGKSYLLPISMTASTQGVKVRADKQNYFYVVKIKGDRQEAAKDSGIVTVMYFEVNDTNPLNAGEWTLKDSRKPMADVVCIFAANINYNAEQGRVYLSLNENVSAILNHKEHYIKPLQDKGIKVTLSVLGNHDAAGVANLAPATCKAFAQEIKATLDAYGLDGIEFDDEYSNYTAAAGIPGFIGASPSSDAYARLCYECKMLMPDKIVGVYHFGAAGFRNSIEGVNPGDFVDYTYEAFYGYPNFSIWSSYKGMSKKQNAPYSRKIADGFAFNSSFMQAVRDEYGVNMLYNYQLKHADSYHPTMSRMTRILYDEECEFSGVKHPKDY